MAPLSGEPLKIRGEEAGKTGKELRLLASVGPLHLVPLPRLPAFLSPYFLLYQVLLIMLRAMAPDIRSSSKKIYDLIGVIAMFFLSTPIAFAC